MKFANLEKAENWGGGVIWPEVGAKHRTEWRNTRQAWSVNTAEARDMSGAREA